MFNLETSIAQWKETLSRIDSVRADDAIELESHLRDLVTTLGKHELSEHEAFLVATHRLGHPSELGKEFSKVHGMNVWRKRVLWMLCGCLLYNIGVVWIEALAKFVSAVVGMTGLGTTAVTSATLVMSVIGWAVFLVFALLKSKSRIAGPERIPYSWAVTGGVVLLLGLALDLAGSVLLMRTLAPYEFGQMANWLAPGFLVVYSLVFLAVVTLLWSLNEPKSDTTDAHTCEPPNCV
ncbi:hypothetical protein [Adhaeretor mobilis]|uniref:Uncharacterized protein n=1 Tax=Adhaeretor mobilis TaxID=1930276 RepID=A0A517MR39_9BACT|nr:hypothetical protein [Adhaeretor mobilis]QDS97257.1 hypothetical protein HG15A2_05180 [Adhaeretor mobilis]